MVAADAVLACTGTNTCLPSCGCCVSNWCVGECSIYSLTDVDRLSISEVHWYDTTGVQPETVSLLLSWESQHDVSLSILSECSLQRISHFDIYELPSLHYLGRSYTVCWCCFLAMMVADCLQSMQPLVRGRAARWMLDLCCAACFKSWVLQGPQ
jgi:hypothetical protein